MGLQVSLWEPLLTVAQRPSFNLMNYDSQVFANENRTVEPGYREPGLTNSTRFVDFRMSCHARVKGINEEGHRRGSGSQTASHHVTSSSNRAERK